MRDTDLKPFRSPSSRIAPDAFLDAALDAIVGMNHDGEIIEFNRAAERLFGYRRAEVLGQPLADVLLPERDREPHRMRLAGYLETGESPFLGSRRETTALKADGTEVPVEICVVRLPGGTLPRFVAFLRDITDRKRAESILRSGEEQLRLIADALPALVSSVDAFGRYVFINKACETWFGRPRAALLGRAVREVIGEETYRALKPHIEAALAGHERIVEAEVDGPDGGRRWIRAHYVPRRGSDGGPGGYVSLVTDITESKRTRDEVERLNASLEERVAERTAQLDAFAYSVSHDLRAPLRAMRGFSQALLEDYGPLLPDELSRLYLQRISQAAERMDHLIEDLLAYSRIGRGDIRLERLSLNAILDIVLKDMGPELQRTRVDVDPALPPVVAHEVTLVQVLKNLISNAVKFVSPGVAARVRVRAEAKGDRVRVWVEDNGIGIAPEHQERIFRVFERLHPAELYPGTGVGLAIVKKGVERMGGSVGVESAAGRGSRFWLDLQAARDAPR